MQFLKRHLIHELEMRDNLLFARLQRPLDGAEAESLQLGAVCYPSHRLVHRQSLYVRCPAFVHHC